MTPALLLHGFTGSAAAMEPLADLLRGAGRPVFTMDLPGHGDAAMAPTTTMMGTVAEVLDAIGVIGDEVHLCGYSMGGRIALSTAVTDPSSIASVATIGASAGIRGEAERIERRLADESLADEIEARGVAWFAQYWAALPIFATQASRLDDLTLERQRRQRMAQQPRGLAASLRGTGTGAMAPLHDALAGLPVPLLALAGVDDAKFSALANELVALVPDGAAGLVANAGHAAHLEAPEAVAGALDRFWSAVDATKPRPGGGRGFVDPPGSSGGDDHSAS